MEFLNQWALPILVLWPLLSAILVFMTKSESADQVGFGGCKPAPAWPEHLSC
jgi:hypothetical protein